MAWLAAVGASAAATGASAIGSAAAATGTAVSGTVGSVLGEVAGGIAGGVAEGAVTTAAAAPKKVLTGISDIASGDASKIGDFLGQNAGHTAKKKSAGTNNINTPVNQNTPSDPGIAPGRKNRVPALRQEEPQVPQFRGFDEHLQEAFNTR